MEDAINASDFAALSEVSKPKSLAKYYVLQEFFKNADVGVASTLYYGKKDKVRACCPWDFDLSSGNYNPELYPYLYIDGDSAKGLFATKMYLDNTFEIPEFKGLIKEIYTQITPWIEKIPEKMDAILQTYADSYKNDVIDQGRRYSEYQYQPLGSLQANMDFLKEWFARRHQYLVDNIVK